MKPLLIFDGNCQAHHLAAILETSGFAECVVNGRDYGLIPSFRGRLCRYEDEAACLEHAAAAAQAGRPVLQASQATPMAGRFEGSYTTVANGFVRFPYLQFSPMLHAAQGQRRTLARLYEVDLESLRLCQAEAPVPLDVAAFVEGEQRRRPLFHMHVHPGPELMALLVRIVCEQIPGLDPDAVSALCAEVSEGEGINMFTQHPLPSELAETLGLSWPDWYQAYGDLITAGRTGDASTLDSRRDEFQELFSHDSQFWGAYFNLALSRGDRAAFAESFERLSHLSAGYVGLWYQAYAHGGRDPVILERARAVFAGQRQLDQLLSRIASEEGRHEDAIESATRYEAAARDLTDGVVPLVLALQAAGKEHEALLAAKECKGRLEEHRRGELDAALARLPQPIAV